MIMYSSPPSYPRYHAAVAVFSRAPPRIRLVHIIAMQNAFLQSPLDDVRVQRRARLVEEQGQAFPSVEAVRDRLPQPRVGLHFLFREQGEEPSMQLLHDRLAVLLVKMQRLLGRQTPVCRQNPVTSQNQQLTGI